MKTIRTSGIIPSFLRRSRSSRSGGSASQKRLPSSRDEAGQGAQQRRLARAVQPDHSDDLALGMFQADAVERRLLTELRGRPLKH